MEDLEYKMALFHLPNTVTNGLTLCLDAGNIKSYPGTGTVWTDICGSRVGTLVNGPSFSSGVLTFNGSNQYVSMSSDTSPAVNNFTYEVWCRPTATHQIDSQSTSSTDGTSGQRYLTDATFFPSPDSGAGISIGTNGVSVYEHAPSYMPALLVDTTAISSTVPTQIVVTYSSKQPSLYLNSTFIKSGFTSPRTNVYGSVVSIGANTSYGYFQGSILLIRFYNRTLTAAEITQNFNASRGRFGI